MRAKLKYLVPLFAILVAIAVPLTNVYSATTIEPSEVSTLAGMSIRFKVTSEYKNSQLNYKVLDSVGSIIKSGTFQTDSNGVGYFTISLSEEGVYTVQVLMNDTVIATASVEIIDIVSYIVPILMVIITIVVIFGVFDTIKKELKF